MNKAKERRSYKNCCAAGCAKTTMTCKDLTFFSLPSDQKRRTEWLQLLRREDIEGKFSTHYRVCENHFDEDSIILTPTRKVLKKNAMPIGMLPIRKSNAADNDLGSTLTEHCSQCQASPQGPVAPQTSRGQLENKCRKKNYPEHLVFSQLCDKFLSKSLSRVVKEQINMQFYPENLSCIKYIQFCQRLYHASPEAYGLLRDTLCLPAKTTLENMFLPITKHVNYMLEALKPLVAQMTDKEKNCALIVGAIKLKANLFYVAEDDTICGFHEFEESQTNEIAEYALVAAVKGILGNYQQLVGYTLLPATKNEERVSKWIDKLIRQLRNVELNVRVLIADTTYSFLDSANQRRVSIEKPYFIVDNRQIYYMFDPSHLMILMRDTLLSYDVYFDEDVVAMWDDIRQVYVRDDARKLRIVPKLTVTHINPSETDKPQAKFAVEVFCSTVAAAISIYADLGGRSQNVKGTVRLLTTMNDIAQFFNLSSRYNIEYNVQRKDLYHVYFLKTALSFFSKFQVMGKNNCRDVTSLLTCVHSFQITLKSLLFLHNCLEMNGNTYILSKRLNNDFLDHFFDGVKKTANSTEPTGWEIVSELRKYYLAVFFKSSEQAENSIANMLSGMPSSLDLSGGNCPEANKRKTNKPTTVASAEEQDKNCFSKQLNSQTGNLVTNNRVNNVIKNETEPDTATFDFGENSCLSFTMDIKQEVIDPVAQEDEHNDCNVQIKKEKEDFLTSEFEIEENELRRPISNGTENDTEFPRTSDSTSGKKENVTLRTNSKRQVPKTNLNNECSLNNDTNESLPHSVKRKREDKVEVEIEEEIENNSESDLMTQVQEHMITMVNKIKTKRKRALFSVLSENVHNIDCSSLCLSETNMLITISGHVIGKAVERHSNCNAFKTYAPGTQNPDVRRYSRYNDYLKNGSTILSIPPPDNFIEYIEELDKIFCGFFKMRQTSINTIMHKVSTVIQSLLKNCKNVWFLKPCECFPDKYIKVLFYRVRLHFTLEHNNRTFNQCQNQRQFVIPALSSFT